MQVVAISTPQEHSIWRWRIVDYAGAPVEESRETFPTIASAVEQWSKRLRQMDVDHSVPIHPFKRLSRPLPERPE